MLTRCQRASVAASILVVFSASGQSFNIDCAGVAGMPPSSSYGAGASQQGYWNATGLTTDLRDLSGNPTGAVFVGSAGGSIDIPGATADDERLMETVYVLTGADSVSIGGLAPGQYEFFVYSWGGNIFGPREVRFDVWNGVDTYAGSLTFGTQWPGGQVEGETFARIPVEVRDGRNFLLVAVFGGGPKSFNVLAGIQLVQIPAPGAPAMVTVGGLLAVRRRHRRR